MIIQQHRFNSILTDGVALKILGQNPNKPTEIDLTAYYNRKEIQQIGSIRIFSQYQTIILGDNDTGISYYFPAASVTCNSVNSAARRFKLQIIPTMPNAPLDIEIIFYEQHVPPVHYPVLLP